ncbi:flagellar biosynthetic protein FliQ [Candidatus Poribacteria bacterium]|nr:flagellar biosynthetic protein FliQ [Candidatus Poribacteria bacterium]MEE2911030.1 flagellar biosynthesis protein FliQ [Candidatus Poribacteria bacterium]|tara:strand:- start:643 stop:912 length:270 start_codon:yes stop_codon:yes gene_type:complete
MKEEAAIYIIRQGMQVLFIVAGPPLIAGLVIGLIVSIFQAATQIQEMTLSFIPKLIAIFGIIILLLPTMIRVMETFARELITNYSYYLQ